MVAVFHWQGNCQSKPHSVLVAISDRCNLFSFLFDTQLIVLGFINQKFVGVFIVPKIVVNEKFIGIHVVNPRWVNHLEMMHTLYRKVFLLVFLQMNKEE